MKTCCICELPSIYNEYLIIRDRTYCSAACVNRDPKSPLRFEPPGGDSNELVAVVRPGVNAVSIDIQDSAGNSLIEPSAG